MQRDMGWKSGAWEKSRFKRILSVKRSDAAGKRKYWQIENLSPEQRAKIIVDKVAADCETLPIKIRR